MNAYPPAPVRSPRLHWLVAVTCVVLIVASIGAALSAAREFVAGIAAVAKPGSLQYRSSTNAEAAHITFTNITTATLYECVRGVVTNKSGKSTKSAIVCTGDLKPHTTIALESPFPVGDVADICAGDAKDPFGNRRLDWDKCTFDIEPAWSAD